MNYSSNFPRCQIIIFSWKVSRAIINSGLTLGKIKAMVSQFAEECQSMIKYLKGMNGYLEVSTFFKIKDARVFEI